MSKNILGCLAWLPFIGIMVFVGWLMNVLFDSGHPLLAMGVFIGVPLAITWFTTREDDE